jgi:transposase-like protein
LNIQLKKNQIQLTPEIDHKILSLFSHGMSYRDMNHHIHDIYGIEVSTGAITAITDQLIPELKSWQQRPLNSVYPIVGMDAVHYKVREEGRYISKAIYTLLGLTVDGNKEILRSLVKRKQLVKIIVRWHIECHREMDNAYSELESGTVPIRYLF